MFQLLAGSCRTSTRCPAMAAAAAIAGLIRWVRALGPWRPTKLRFEVEAQRCCGATRRSEEHTSELQSLMRISYAVFCLKTKKNTPRSDYQHYRQQPHNI